MKKLDVDIFVISTEETAIKGNNPIVYKGIVYIPASTWFFAEMPIAVKIDERNKY